MSIPRSRVYNPVTKQHWVIICLDFLSDKFIAQQDGEKIEGKISDNKIEMMAPCKDKRGLDIYEGDVVRYGRDRILITFEDEHHGAFLGKNLSFPNPYGRLGDISMMKLSGNCELLGPEILGH